MSDKTATAPPIMVAIQGFACPEGTFATGMRVRADHPAVRNRPLMWAPEDSTEDEKRALFAERFPGLVYPR
jgi:hypothetical protein